MRSFCSWVAGLAMLGLCCGVAVAQEEAPDVVEGLEVGGAPVEIKLSGASFPYALRVHSLMKSLAAWQAKSTEVVAAKLRNRGLDPESAAGQELLELAREFEDKHRRRSVPEETLRAFADDDEGFYAWHQEQNERVAAAIGAGFGLWLSRRKAEGYALDPLIDRLLNYALSSSAHFSNDPEERWRRSVDGRCRAFEAAMLQSLDSLPRQFRRDEEE